MRSLLLLAATAFCISTVLSSCTVDTGASSDRCIGTDCTSSEQCISGNCLGFDPIFKCAGCNDNDQAKVFKCPGRFCNTGDECTVKICNTSLPGAGFNGTCGGTILGYQGLKQW